MKLRKKPPEFEGEQYHRDAPHRMSGKFRDFICFRMCPSQMMDGVPHIHGGDSMQDIFSGDWLVLESNGVLSICKAADFDSTYEQVTE